MKHITTWHPDTCDCVVSYEWDDTDPQETRIHTLHSIQNKCLAHQSLSDQEVYDTLFEENPRKNFTLEIFRANFPKLTKLNANGEYEIDISKISWSFNGNRVLEISVPSLSIAEKVTANNFIITRFGSGKVTII